MFSGKRNKKGTRASKPRFSLHFNVRNIKGTSVFGYSTCLNAHGKKILQVGMRGQVFRVTPNLSITPSVSSRRFFLIFAPLRPRPRQAYPHFHAPLLYSSAYPRSCIFAFGVWLCVLPPSPKMGEKMSKNGQNSCKMRVAAASHLSTAHKVYTRVPHISIFVLYLSRPVLGFLRLF